LKRDILNSNEGITGNLHRLLHRWLVSTSSSHQRSCPYLKVLRGRYARTFDSMVSFEILFLGTTHTHFYRIEVSFLKKNKNHKLATHKRRWFTPFSIDHFEEEIHQWLLIARSFEEESKQFIQIVAFPGLVYCEVDDTMIRPPFYLTSIIEFPESYRTVDIGTCG